MLAEWSSKSDWDGPKLAEVRAAIDEEDVNATSAEGGRTALMNACAFCSGPDGPEIVNLLLSKGANAATADSSGRTVLHHLAGTNTSTVAECYARALLAAGADPRMKDGKGNSVIADAKKKKNAGVLSTLEVWTPPPPPPEALVAVRAQSSYNGWRQVCVAAIDARFDADAEMIELLAVTDEGCEVAAHDELSALIADLEAAYRNGTMGGGSFRQLVQARIGQDKIVSKLSKLDEGKHVILTYCPVAKRDGVQRKVAKANDKCGNRICVAWV